MAQLETTHTFVDGETVNAASINNIIDQASAQDGIIGEQSPLVGAISGSDQILLWDATGTPTKLRRALISALPGAGTVTTVSATATPTGVFGISVATPTSTPAIALTLDNQGSNKVLAAPADGTTGQPAFRALVPNDLPIATVTVAAGVVDCTSGVVFTKTLPTGTGPFGMTITDLANGQTIRVGIINNAAGNNKITWLIGGSTPTIVWRNTGPAPVVTQAPNSRDVFTFTRIGTFTYGYADQNFTT